MEKRSVNDFFLKSLVSSAKGHFATESYGDVAVFFETPDNYLESKYNANQSASKDLLYTEPLSTGGNVFMAVEQIGKDLRKVNAYNEALLIYQTVIDRLELIKSNSSKEDVMNINGTVETLKSRIIDTMTEREDYNVARKSVLAKYSPILKELK